MLMRTSKANSAILSAWLREQKLVLEGKGTRDWTPEQQKDIITKGKAYDEDGRAFEGHHMKSVEKYPNYQGNPDNIQFLSRKEHKEAHGGDYHLPTNGFYNFKTHKTSCFEEDQLVRCKVYALSESIMIPIKKNKSSSSPDGESHKKCILHNDSDSAILNKKCLKNLNDDSDTYSSNGQEPTKQLDSQTYKETRKRIEEYQNSRSFWEKCLGFTLDYSDLILPTIEFFGNTFFSSKGTDSANSTGLSGRSVIDRKSPKLHDVKEYTRYFNDKGIHVKSYKRGGNKII